MKKLYYIFVLIVALLLQACGNPHESPIPDSRVDIQLNMLSYDPTFGSVLNDTLIFTYPRQLPPFLLGFGGVMIVVGFDENLNTRYFSYDLACPYEADPKVRVFPNKELDGYAVCPKCGSEYYITDGWGRVSKGPSKYPLRRYETNFINNFLIVRN